MKKTSLIYIALGLQFLILFSVIGKYEYIKNTGITAYIEASGYDPTDLFKWDYVNVQYRLPVPEKYNSVVEDMSFGTFYIVPEIKNNVIVWIESIGKKRPKEEIFMKLKNAWVQKSQILKVQWSNGIIYSYSNTWCDEKNYKKGWKVFYNLYNNEITYVMPYAENIWANSGNLEGIISELSACQNTISLSTSQTDRFYVQDKTWWALEKKVQNGQMYAKWKIGKNGFILFEDLVEKESIQ
jgi:hypothetical protein